MSRTNSKEVERASVTLKLSTPLMPRWLHMLLSDLKYYASPALYIAPSIFSIHHNKMSAIKIAKESIVRMELIPVDPAVH
eukprot:3615982-Amphidinium_carterae.1